MVTLLAGGATFQAAMAQSALIELPLAEGALIWLNINRASIHVLVGFIQLGIGTDRIWRR